MNKSVEAFFRGTVQGVGFRFTARSLADKYGIKGWVMNLSDGGVRLAAQGSQEDLDSFFEDLKERFDDQIADFQIKDKELLEECNDFQVKLDSC